MSNNRVNLKKVIHAANIRGLYVLPEGSSADFKYQFWDRKTGKWVMTYYPASKRRLTLNQEGLSDNVLEAIAFLNDAYPTRDRATRVQEAKARKENDRV